MAKKLRYEAATEFSKGKAARLFQETFESKDPMVVTHHGKGLVVILAADEYERISKRKIRVELCETK
ncbi:MAG: type II toxin-antitoxin system prevent-host-death family antitoxin [Erysipelotrichaceae bacterium]